MKTKLLIMSAAMTVAACGTSGDSTADKRPLIGQSEIQLSNRQFTPEALWAMGRIGDVSVSPTGEQIA